MGLRPRLPAELADMVTACLERSPRKRPTSAAILAQLAPYLESALGHGPPPLPGPAVALIAEYQQHPQPFATQAPDEISDDATFGSRTGLPAPRRPRVPHWPPWPGRHGRGSASGGTTFRPPSGQARRRRKTLIVAGLACGAAVLVAGGAVLGAELGATGSKSAGVPPGFLPPPGPPPPSGVSTRLTSTPAILLNQRIGDGNTDFVLHGSGWVPGRRITVAIVGRGDSPDWPTVDGQGTFNYAINQNHEFFPQRIPPGIYRVVVTEFRGARKRTSFLVVVPPRPPRSRLPVP